jgi:hypothetical protein
VRDGAFHAGFDLAEGPRGVSLVWAAYVDKPVLEDLGTPTTFKYREYFDSVNAVIEWARDDQAAIRYRSLLFDSVFAESSLGKTQVDLIAYTFQSYLSNTWWTRRPDGSDWFSVWEGVCLFNSTIDVEYNLGLFYFALWPELLQITFREWARHEQPDGFLSHDMGGGVRANGQSYPHPMEVEENTNFLLMLHAYWRWTGSDAPVREHAELVERLVGYLLRSDTTGNGFPNVGTANTIDDASAAVQYSREQTYLGVKALCALECAADLLDRVGNPDLAAACRECPAAAVRTLDTEAWLGDHYAVCIDKETAGLMDIWDRASLPDGELPGWDAYSLYTSNGMLYPLIVGKELPLDRDRIRGDLEASLRESLIEYGCTHSSADRSNVWVSQNLWRDFIAAYLGVDCLGMAGRYWAFLVQENTQHDGKGFIDTYVANNLCYYPRGITSIGVFLAALGLSLDRVTGTLRLRPVRVPCRIPLLPLANWESGNIPWAEFRLEGGRVVGRIEGELPAGLTVDM